MPVPPGTVPGAASPQGLAQLVARLVAAAGVRGYQCSWGAGVFLVAWQQVWTAVRVGPGEAEEKEPCVSGGSQERARVLGTEEEAGEQARGGSVPGTERRAAAGSSAAVGV